MRRLIQRVPGIDFVLTTLYFPFGFQTSIDTGFAIESSLISLMSEGDDDDDDEF
jgi:hypothetical protein